MSVSPIRPRMQAVEEQRTIADILREMAENMMTLMRTELEVIKIEIRESTRIIGQSSVFVVMALECLSFFLLFLGCTLVFLVDRIFFNNWTPGALLTSCLITAVIFLVVTAVMGKMTMDKIKRLSDVNRTI